MIISVIPTEDNNLEINYARIIAIGEDRGID